MTTFWLTFRISDKTVDSKTYDDRYQDLTNSIKSNVSSKYWEQTTSFYVFDSDQTIDQLANTFKKLISISDDLFLIRELGRASAYICGKNDDADIYTLIPYLKKA